MVELTQETRDGLLMAVAEAIVFHDGTVDDLLRRQVVKKLLERANRERNAEVG